MRERKQVFVGVSLLIAGAIMIVGMIGLLWQLVTWRGAL